MHFSFSNGTFFWCIHVNFREGNLWNSPFFGKKTQTALVIRFDHSQDAWVEWVDPSKPEGKWLIFQSHPNFAGDIREICDSFGRGQFLRKFEGSNSWEKKTTSIGTAAFEIPSLGKKDPKYQGRQSPTRKIPTSSRACEICLQQRGLTTAGWMGMGWERDGRLSFPSPKKKKPNSLSVELQEIVHGSCYDTNPNFMHLVFKGNLSIKNHRFESSLIGFPPTFVVPSKMTPVVSNRSVQQPTFRQPPITSLRSVS